MGCKRFLYMCMCMILIASNKYIYIYTCRKVDRRLPTITKIEALEIQMFYLEFESFIIMLMLDGFRTTPFARLFFVFFKGVVKRNR